MKLATAITDWVIVWVMHVGMGEVSRGMLSPIGYTGYQREMRPDHYHAMSRSYDAALGRFRSRDVEEYIKLTDTLTLNRYLYCGANPLSYVDVMGFGFTDYLEPQIQESEAGWTEWADGVKAKIDYTDDPNRGLIWNGALGFLSGLGRGFIDGVAGMGAGFEAFSYRLNAVLADTDYAVGYAKQMGCNILNLGHYLWVDSFCQTPCSVWKKSKTGQRNICLRPRQRGKRLAGSYRI